MNKKDNNVQIKTVNHKKAINENELKILVEIISKGA